MHGMQRLRTTQRLVHSVRSSTLHTKSTLRASWPASPASPRLPKEEQELFEKLQKSSTGAFSTPNPGPVDSQSSSPPPSEFGAKIKQSADTPPSAGSAAPVETSGELKVTVKAEGDGEELHPHIRRGAQPEFEGDRNPKTGEVGGPKNEPLRWGERGDWSYNGRVTDF